MDDCRAPLAEQNAERAAEQAAEVASVEQQLADVQAALGAVEQRGQRVRIKDRDIWRPDLAALDKRQQRLELKAARAKAGGVRMQRIIPL